ncbi:hypothetical protein RFI_08284 [Reticulomyxa filosa]|uniref:Uncharacterized protein n=1 Tax=Reticulomyxa filosa TaxID=46433 RepID=X6NSV7_RETFI|nr:hypothetical protein RFI_08284 [Reticulomyxa filosa]|eukprot:ETO28844.1 hypothetical protein RFI_08284 [Reticulomyxa filosa]
MRKAIGKLHILLLQRSGSSTTAIIPIVWALGRSGNNVLKKVEFYLAQLTFFFFFFVLPCPLSLFFLKKKKALLSIWQSDKPRDLRCIAAVKFKNDCEAIWSFSQLRSSENVKERKEEKTQCKAILLKNFQKESDEMVSASARNKIEDEGGWPELFPYLTECLKQASSKLCGIEMYKTLLVLNDICDDINSARMLVFVDFFNYLSKNMLPILCPLWDQLFQALFAKIGKCSVQELQMIFKMCEFTSNSIQIIMSKSHPISFVKDSIVKKFFVFFFNN